MDPVDSLLTESLRAETVTTCQAIGEGLSLMRTLFANGDEGGVELVQVAARMRRTHTFGTRWRILAGAFLSPLAAEAAETLLLSEPPEVRANPIALEGLFEEAEQHAATGEGTGGREGRDS